MRRKHTLFWALVLAMALGSIGQATPPPDDLQTFWQKFKTAVINGDKETVAALSRFPIGMSYGIRSIKTKPDLIRRYREVFSAQTNAVKCFGRKGPEKDESDPKKFSVACPDQGGNEVVIFEFELTRAGWRFVALDNINE